MKRSIVLVAVLACALVATAPAEAAKTSAKEGRKFSRKYLKQDSVNRLYDWHQDQCYRIGGDGVGAYRIFPGGVACLFSADPRRGPADCILYGIAVKDGKRHIQAANIAGIFPYHGDPADCDRGAPYPEWPPLWGGITGDPLRPVV